MTTGKKINLFIIALSLIAYIILNELNIYIIFFISLYIFPLLFLKIFNVITKTGRLSITYCNILLIPYVFLRYRYGIEHPLPIIAYCTCVLPIFVILLISLKSNRKGYFDLMMITSILGSFVFYVLPSTLFYVTNNSHMLNESISNFLPLLICQLIIFIIPFPMGYRIYENRLYRKMTKK